MGTCSVRLQPDLLRRVTITGAFLLYSAVAAAQTCDCGHREAPCGAYWTAPAIFVGRVDAIQRSAGGRSITFTVLERYRGTASSNVTITVGPAGQRCSLSFKVGREYLVYASRADTGGWTASACSRTRAVEDAASDLAYARAVKDGTAPAGLISGQVVALNHRGGLTQPVPNATITVDSAHDQTSQTAVTNQAGDFSVPSHGPGRYLVLVSPPAGFVADESSTVLELTDARSCVGVERRIYYDGALQGRVMTAAGHPLPGLTVDLATTNNRVVTKAITDNRGYYRFTRLSPDRFVIGINLSERRTTTLRAPRVFYPGVLKVTGARRVTVGPGAHVALEDFTLPLQTRVVAIAGVVIDPDGMPAAGARVYLKGTGEGDPIVSEPVATDSWGRFAISAIASDGYRLFAERSRADGSLSRVESTDEAVVTTHEAVSSVRLRLRRRY
jgi:Carboxypeptidase regulatory-like domain